MKKALIAEVKNALNFLIWIWKIDACCPRSYQSSLKADKYTKEKVFNRNFSISQKPRSQPLYCSKNIKTFDRLWKDYRNNSSNRRGCCNCSLCNVKPQGSTPTTGINTTNFSAWNNYDWPFKRDDKALNQVIYYNYNKKDHFANQYTEAHKPKN